MRAAHREEAHGAEVAALSVAHAAEMAELEAAHAAEIAVVIGSLREAEHAAEASVRVTPGPK